jgi:hypothetical protein
MQIKRLAILQPRSPFHAGLHQTHGGRRSSSNCPIRSRCRSSSPRGQPRPLTRLERHGRKLRAQRRASRAETIAPGGSSRLATVELTPPSQPRPHLWNN